MNRICEIFGLNCSNSALDFKSAICKQQCPFTQTECSKMRKSAPEIKIGTCSIKYQENDIIICPLRMLEEKKFVKDCKYLFDYQYCENDWYLIPEVKIPGGQVDYFLANAHQNQIKDFVGIEIQSIDTTGTVWPERQRFLHSMGLNIENKDLISKKPFSLNWKMSLKTTLIQMLHKSRIFEQMKKHLVLVIQQPLLDFMNRDFCTDKLQNTQEKSYVHIHSYNLLRAENNLSLSLFKKIDTNSECIAACLDLSDEKELSLENAKKLLSSKLCSDLLITDMY